MKKVIVLMSTYNGEKYVSEQIDSILSQTYSNIEILVRDDGSKDKTVEILKKYEKENKIQLIQGENVGFIKSFFSLIKEAGEADYYAFSDQDDVWFENKIEKAVSLLEKEEKNIPILYFAAYDFYNANMEFTGHGGIYKKGPSFRNSLVDCITLGINCVMNKKAVEMMKQDIPQNSCGHDWWTYMLCSGLGKVIYDTTPVLKYRRHDNNVSAGGMNFIKFQIWRIKKFFVNGYFKNVKEQLKEYETLYGNKLSKENQKLLKLFTNTSFGNWFKKVFYPKMFRQKLTDEILLRIIFVIGKL